MLVRDIIMPAPTPAQSNNKSPRSDAPASEQGLCFLIINLRILLQ